MSKSIFIDFNVLVKQESKAWIVDKRNANTPILKINESDFKLIKNGIYKSQGNKMDFNGRTYYLPTSLMNKIKIKTKSLNVDFSNLAISLQEYMNREIIESKDYEVNMELISNIKNEISDIYVICSNQTKKSHGKIIENINETLHQNGLKIKTIYPISENFMNQNSDDIKFKKMRLFLQHLVGYKTDGLKFIDEEITQFSQIDFYDNLNDTLNITKEINNLLEFLLSRTDDGLRSVIKENIQEFKPILIVHKINDNRLNKIQSDKVILNISKIVKTFENFNPYS